MVVQNCFHKQQACGTTHKNTAATKDKCTLMVINRARNTIFVKCNCFATKAEWHCCMRACMFTQFCHCSERKKKKKTNDYVSRSLCWITESIAVAVLFLHKPCANSQCLHKNDMPCFTGNSINTTKCTYCKWHLFSQQRSMITAQLTHVDWKWTLAHLRNQLVNLTKRNNSFTLVFVCRGGAI